eukprot:scaffold27915_cov101-Isochrysis_galbana.AAC.2
MRSRKGTFVRGEGDGGVRRRRLPALLTSSFSVASWYDPSLAGAITITGMVLDTILRGCSRSSHSRCAVKGASLNSSSSASSRASTASKPSLPAVRGQVRSFRWEKDMAETVRSSGSGVRVLPGRRQPSACWWRRVHTNGQRLRPGRGRASTTWMIWAPMSAFICVQSNLLRPVCASSSKTLVSCGVIGLLRSKADEGGQQGCAAASVPRAPKLLLCQLVVHPGVSEFRPGVGERRAGANWGCAGLARPTQPPCRPHM